MTKDEQQPVRLTRSQRRMVRLFARWMRAAKRHGVVLVLDGSRRVGMTWRMARVVGADADDCA